VKIATNNSSAMSSITFFLSAEHENFSEFLFFLGVGEDVLFLRWLYLAAVGFFVLLGN
jgi:hypothetical protein